MWAVLEILTGPHRGRRVEVKPGQVFKVGRTRGANLSLPEDALLSNSHFALECDAQGCRLRDLGSRFGTFVNQAPVTEARLNNGDRITAGRTTFVVRLKEDAPPAAAPTLPLQGAATVARAAPATVVGAPSAGAGPSALQGLLTLLRGSTQTQYALLDGARDPKVFDLLRYSKEEYQSLFEGPEAEELEDWAPYLVKLPADSPLLEKLVSRGWGNCWGVYLTSARPFQEVRGHFRHFLTVELEGEGPIYFRFYDPRVLRFFLPTCTPEQVRQLFGPVTDFMMEAKNPEVLMHFTQTRGKLRVQSLALPALAAAAGMAATVARGR